MPENVNLTDDQKAKLGAEVAQVKTLLNEVENKISTHDLNGVDWQDVSAKLRSLDGKVNELSGNVVTRESLPPPANEEQKPSVETTEELAKSGAFDDEDEDETEDYETGPPPPPFSGRK